MAAKRQQRRRPTGDVIEVKGGQQLHDIGGGIYAPVNPEDALFDGGVEELPTMEPALQGVLTELGAADENAKVTVFQVKNVNGVKKQAYLFEVHPTAFTLADLQEGYGEGDYRVMVYGKQEGTNYKVLHANKVVTIGPTRAERENRANGARNLGSLAVSSDAGLAKALADALGAPMAAMAGMMKEVLTRQGGSRQEIISELTALASIFPKPQPAQNPLEQLGLLKSLLDVVKPAAGAGGEIDAESGPYLVLTKAIEAFAPALIQAKANAAVASEAAPSALPAPQSIQPEEESAMLESLALKTQLMMLLNAAKVGAETETYATLVYEQAPDSVIEKLQGENWHADLVAMEPGFSDPAAKIWAEKVRAEVLEMLKEDAAGDGGAANEADAGSTGAGVVKP